MILHLLHPRFEQSPGDGDGGFRRLGDILRPALEKTIVNAALCGGISAGRAERLLASLDLPGS